MDRDTFTGLCFIDWTEPFIRLLARKYNLDLPDKTPIRRQKHAKHPSRYTLVTEPQDKTLDMPGIEHITQNIFVTWDLNRPTHLRSTIYATAELERFAFEKEKARRTIHKTTKSN